MKILQIIPSISLVYGGPSQMILGLSKTLANLGHDVTIITTNSNGDQGQLPLDVPLKIPQLQDGYRIIYFNCSPFKRYKFSWSLLRWLNTHGKDYDIAHIHALFSPVSTFSAMICRNNNIPYILRCLGTLDPKDLQKKRMLKYFYGNLLEKPNLAGSVGVHFTTQKEAEVSETFGAKVNNLVIPLGVEIPERLVDCEEIYNTFSLPRDKVLCLFMSRIEPKKGLDLFIPTLERLLSQGLDFHFILAGSNPQDQDYVDKINGQINSSIILKEHTTIAGFVRGKNKIGLLQLADLFLLPSYYENFGIAVAEAIALSTPVLISNQVYISDDIEKANAGWVCELNQEDLSNKLILALENHSQRQEKGNNGLNLAKNNYSWNAIALQLIKKYEELSKKK